jgi:LmbE family N-acetylglucosaminyl deacetylase
MRVLAVGCHPDDLEIGCGGTLALYAKQGHEVFMAHVANGNLGHAVIKPSELREIRRKEARNAGEILGAKEVFSLDIGDLMVSEFNETLVTEMAALIRHTRPDVIITHAPQDYMRDHVQTGQLVFNASFASSVPHYAPDSQAFPLIPPIYHMDTLAGVNFLPVDYVDISETIDQKLEALACHESQIKWMLEHDKIDFLDFVKTCAKFRGLQCGAKFAEGFGRCQAWPRIPTKRLLP